MPIMYILAGNIGTGKSRFAAKLARREGAIIVSMDSISASCHGGDGDRYDSLYRSIYHASEKALIAESFNQDTDVIVDRTCINRQTRSRYINWWKRKGGHVVGVSFGQGDQTTLKRRVLSHRGVPRYTWEGIHRSNMDRWEIPTEDEGFDLTIGFDNPEFTYYAFDFDGTIVEDKFPRIGNLNKGVFAYMRALDEDSENIILVWTSRTKDYLWQAREFLVKNGVPFDFLNENPMKLSHSRKVYYDHYLSAKNAPFDIEQLLEQV